MIEPDNSATTAQPNINLVLQPIQGDIFDLLGSIPVNELQDFDKLRETAMKHVAKKVMRDLQDSSSFNETI